jgi:uncharacterized protein (DUF1501 family)
MLPASLTGAVAATALQSIGDYHLAAEGDRGEEMRELLQALYRQDATLLSAIADQTLAAIDVLNQIDTRTDTESGRRYPQQDFGRALHTVAQLVGADVGVEVACIDLGGWDTHVAQGGTEGIMAQNLAELGQGLAAFYEELQQLMKSVTVLVMSEFGRRVQENGGLGTDHGHGNMMMMMGGGINGNRVFAQWPGLNEAQQVGPGDLAITTDYRDILGELIRKRLNNPRLNEIFPGYTVTEQGVAVGRGVRLEIGD